MDLQSILDRSPNVLIADDDKGIRELLQAYLESSGCRVILPMSSPHCWLQVLSGSRDVHLEE